MRDLRVAVAQFEAADADKKQNLERIATLARAAVDRGAELVSFHECSISGYTFLQTLSRSELAALAEPVPDGPSTAQLERIAREQGVALGAGLIEIDDDRLYNTYVIVAPDGFVAKHRKLHAFVSPHLSSGDRHTVFDLLDCRWGILICYDNNLPENVRVTTMLGAEIILMPHVTCGLDSVMPGRGRIRPELWEARDRDPVPLRLEFEGPKGRGWLMRWLPCRAFENGVYALFSNAVGRDWDTIKTGCSMILDPYGEVLAESRALGDDVVVALLTADKIETASGRRYLKARRPELYAKLVEPRPPGDEPVTLPGWKLDRPKDA
ncbi:MAG TPA: nitrilase family protein [Planctomycetota bacterium]|nr:nitrilase family protein [Planctomycetota bacterium]